MVTRTARVLLLLGVWALARGAAAANPPAAPEYRPGDILAADLIAPVPLVVVNPEATAELRAREAQRVPAVFGFDPRAATVAADRLHAAFHQTRSNFVRRLEENFRALPLSPATVESPRFRRVVGAFLRQGRPLFPVTTNLLQRWAQGDSGEVELARLQRHLAAVMERPIRPDTLPPDIKLGPQVRVVRPARAPTQPGEPVEPTATLVARSNLLTVTRAQAQVQQAFPAEDAATGKFLAGLIRANCVLDADQTRRLRAEHVEPLCVVDRYARGELIAAAGQVVDARVLAAWKQLRELNTTPAGLRAPFWPPPAWVGLGLGGLAVALSGWLWWLLTARPKTSLLPARVQEFPGMSPGREAVHWQRRAREAEQRAARVTAGVRDGLLGQLADFLKSGWAQTMWRQRDELLRAQQHAAREVAGLTARLDQVRAPLQERLRAYEARIAELEAELAAQDAANRELIRVTIALVRHQLEAERNPTPIRWN